MKISPGQILAIGAVGITALVLVRTASAARRAANAINPLNNQNVISEGFNDAVGAVTGNDGFSLGSFLFDLFNPEFDPNAPSAKLTPPKIFDTDEQQSVAL